jgi:hypothetical protein
VSTALVHAVLCVAPALALWVVLVLGRYPGERAVAALAALAGRAPPAATAVTWFVPQT